MVSTLVAFAIMELGMSYAVATFAVNFALSLIVTRIFAENPEQQQDMGVRQQVPPSAVNAIPIVYGNAYMGGTFVDAVLTTDQKTMYYVLAISSISPNGQFTFDTADMYFGDRKITFDATDLTKVVSLTDEAGNVNTKINGNLYINLYTSTDAGVITSSNGASAPSTVMGGSDIAVGQRWTGTRQMNGLGFAIVKLIYNRDADTTQLSPITFKVAHTLNGTGVAKAGDVWYDYMTNAVYGGAVDAAFLNSTSATALNTYGDQTITFTNSSGNPATQARYRINGVLDAGQSVLSNIDRIMSACDSWMTYNAALGQWSVVVNKAESTAYAFTDNNIIGEIRVSATDITTSINQVEARFPFKDNRDQAAFVNIETPSGLLYPNEPVNKYSITYDMVNDSVQASYLANRLLEQAREDLIVGFSTTYYGIQVDAGDVVSVTNSDYGWNAKLFRVMKVNEASLPDGSLGAKLELSEYNAAVYDDATIQQFAPVPNSGLPSVSYFSPLAAPTVTGFPVANIPYINVQVFIPTTGRVTFGNLFWTTSATPTASDWKLITSATTTDGQPVTNGTYYTFSNITLNSGTYYFAYMVGNDVTSSVLSPISAALVWSPVAGAGPTGATGPSGSGPTGATGPSGPTGVSGLNSATVYLYNKNTSTTPPTLFSGTFTYTFATGVLSGGTLNGWSQTPPSISEGEYLFLSIATASSTSATDLIAYTEFSTPQVISSSGANGANTAIVSLFNKNTSAVTPPTAFSGTFTYTFSTAALSGGTLNGWSQSIPTLANGEYLWQRQATAFSTASTDTIATAEFSSAVVSGAAGATGPTGISGPTGFTGPTGTNGLNSASVFLYNKNTTTTPPALFSGTFTYTFATGVLSGGTLNGWSQTPPSIAAGEFLFLSLATASSSSATDSVPTTEFSTPQVISGTGTNGATGATGTNGANTAIVGLYNKNTSAIVPPTSPSGTFTYTFATAALSGGTLNGWSQTAPTLSSGEYLWEIQATAFGIGATDTIASTEFSGAVVVGAAGATGPTGITGPTGTTGPTGSGINSASIYLYNKNTSTTPPSLFSGTFTYTFATGVLSGGTLNGWSQTPPSVAAGEFLFLSLATASNTTATDTVLAAEFSTPQVISGTGTNGATGATGTNGANTAVVSLFNKNTSGVTPPTSPSGTFTYTFATATLSGGTLNGWSQSAPTLASGEYLWQIQATAFAIGATDTIASTEFSGAVVVGIAGTSGATGPTGTLGPTGPTGTATTGPTGQAGLQVARPAVYQWALSTPSISGSSTYTWATAAYTAPSGWSTTITAAPSAGFILYTATVTVTDVATATSTAFSWTSASIVVSGYAGTNGATGPTGGTGVTGPTGGAGASARIMYARIASNPTPVSGTVTVSGDNRPSGAEASAVWGASFNVTWYANDPDPSSNNSLYQADGIYNGSTTSWSTPYISALKVGALSAVSTNTGSLTVSGTLQSNTATISGTTMTGSGGVLYSTGYFAFGDASSNITYNGTAININGLANASSSSFTVGTDITSNTSSPYSLLTFTKKNATTGLISISASFQLNTSYIGADSIVLNLVLTLRGNNGWSINPSTQRIQSVLGPTASTAKQGGAPLTFVFMFNTNDWGSGATGATSITAGLIYSAGLYNNAGTLLTSSSADWTLTMIGSNNSFYQPLLGS